MGYTAPIMDFGERLLGEHLHQPMIIGSPGSGGLDGQRHAPSLPNRKDGPSLPSLPMALYAAYASNLHPERMAKRAPHSPLESTGWLRGWRLTFGGEERGWDGALATVVEAAGSLDHQVFVAVYDLTDSDAEQLDAWEGVDIGLYTKVKVRVDTLEGELLAWTYALDDYEGGMPSAFYLGMLADAAEAAGAPDDYVRELRSRPCRSVG